MRLEKQVQLKGELFFFFLLIFIYRLFLDWIFIEVISTKYGYMGFQNKWSFISSALSLIVLFVFTIPIFNAYKNENNLVSHEILFCIFLMSFVPFTSMFAFNNITELSMLLNMLYWILLIKLILFPSLKTEIKLGNERRISFERFLPFFSIISVLVVVYVSGKYAHFRINLNLDEVYSLRSEASNYSMPVVLSYVYSWTRNLNAIFITYYIRKKKYLWAFICLMVQLLNYGIDGSKTTLVLVAIAVGVNIFPELNIRRFNKLILFGFAILPIISLLFYKILGNIWPASLFVRRILFIPVQITDFYVDFFMKNTPDYFRQSFIKIFGIKSVYPHIPYMIGEIYTHTVTSANNGLLSDALLNLGIIGIIVFPVLICAVFKLFDACITGLDSHMYVVIAVYVSMTLINSYLFTSLLTHGLLITMLMLKIMKRDKGCDYENMSPNECP